LQINGTLKGIDIEYLDANYIVKQIIPWINSHNWQ
jgi:hypothetical protein